MKYTRASLIKELSNLGIPVVSGKVKKSDIRKVLAAHQVKASTDYLLDGVGDGIPVKEFKKKLKGIGLEIDSEKGDSFSITDGSNYLWIHVHGGKVSFLTGYGMSNVEDIIELLEDAFGFEAVSEEDERYLELSGNL